MLTVDLSALDLQDGDTALDLGCGRGRHLHAMYHAARIHAVGIDLGFDDVARTRDGFDAYPDAQEDSAKTYTLSVGNALSLPFADATFDKIVCSEVLEHIPDYHAALGEIMRVLKPNGNLAVSVPRYWPERICWALSHDYRNDPGGHVRIFRTSELKESLKSVGFSYKGGHWAHALHVPYWWLKCALGLHRTDSRIVNLYHRFLVWDLMKRPKLTRALESLLDPLMGKSIVLYFAKG